MRIRAFPFLLALAAFISAALSSPRSWAAPGDLYDGGLNRNKVYRFTPDGAGEDFVAGPYADYLAFDSRGNLFVSDQDFPTRIAKITPNRTITTFASGLSPTGIAFDEAGNLYAGDRTTNSILKFTPEGNR